MTRHFHLVAILLSIFIPRAFAETSSNDPLIMQLRTQIVNARIPTLKDLRAGASWFCTKHSAVRGEPSAGQILQEFFRFNVKGKNLRKDMQFSYADDKSIFWAQRPEHKNLKEGGFFSPRSISTYVALRTEPDGLIAEYLADNSFIQAEPSVSNNSKVVLAYLVCKRRDRRILIAPPSSSSSSDYSFGSVPETHHHHADHGGCDAGHSH